ncbi:MULTISPECIES: TetR/AcrR family transcriptional regulator [unclassified Streptomyces]|uniref:TetR/AcrR family transcriptional regulator n=1 Tax=unclassified Streptomyces TaxID=2593676 RepID=UPI0006FEA8E7|nr:MULTISPECIES: TetR/AcrR family transcriptional regulator [unclassified Streptomyces]KQX58034.1 TetR family transcriptional regulator [Streptomyces sp. Root1304]KRA95382.1 TetR family transcriptional regulator [Streptomyces sp. Root66D1]
MADGARARRLPRAVRERQMLDAAVRSFARHGYQAASMDEIAELAGVSKPLVYLYLNSKEELFTAVIRREAQALLAVVAEAVVDRGAPPDERLWAGLSAFFAYAAEQPDSWAVLSRQARTQGEPFAGEAARMREEITAFVAGLIGEAAREARDASAITERDVAALAQALVGSAESLASWANETAGVTAKEAAATLMNFAWSGLGNLMKNERWAPR